MRRYRVWTKNFSEREILSIMTGWRTYADCKKFVLARWGHWPPFAFISSAKNIYTFIAKNGY